MKRAWKRMDLTQAFAAWDGGVLRAASIAAEKSSGAEGSCGFPVVWAGFVPWAAGEQGHHFRPRCRRRIRPGAPGTRAVEMGEGQPFFGTSQDELIGGELGILGSNPV